MPRSANILTSFCDSLAGLSVAALSDRHLLERFTADRDEAAFAALLDRHGPLVRGVCRRIVRDDHQADDVFQAAFVVLARKAGTLRQGELLGNWLFGVAIRLARKARQQQSRRREVERRAQIIVPRTEPSSWDDLLMILDEELQKLPAECRAPLLACYHQGRTQDEAARELGWSVRTLRRRLERGRELLRGRMVRRGATFSAGLFATALTSTAVEAALRETAVSAALRGSASPAVAGLAATTTRTVAAKLSRGIAVAMTAVGLMIGVGLMARLPAQPQDAPPPNPPAKPVAEALPDGAVARLGAQSFRHGGVRSLAFVGEGKTLLSVGFGYARLWDLEAGRELHHVGGPDETADLVVSAAVRKGGKTAVLFTRRQATERTVLSFRIWDLEDWKEVRRFEMKAPDGRKTALAVPTAVSPDGKRMAELDSAGDVWLWDVAAGKAERRLDHRDHRINAVVFTPDSLSVVTGGDAHTVRVWDATTGAVQRSFGKAKDPISCLAISADGQILATAGDRVRLWDFAKGIVVRELAWVKQGKPAGGRIEEVAFSPDGKLIHAGGTFRNRGNHLLRLRWDVQSGQGRGEADYGGLFLMPAAYRADSQWVVEGASSGYLMPLDLKNRVFKFPPDFVHWQIRSLAFSPEGKTLRTTDASDEFREYDLATGTAAKRIYVSLGAMGTLTISPDGRVAVGVGDASDETAKLGLFDPVTGKERQTFPGNRAAFSPDGRWLVAASPDRRVRVVDLNTEKEVRSFDGAAEGTLLVSRDNRTLVTVSDTVSVQDFADGKERASWKIRRGLKIDDARTIRGAAVSPDGKRLALGVERDGTGDDRFRVLVCETDTGKLLWDGAAGMYPAMVLAFSPDGKTLASGGWRVTLWDTAAGQKTRTLDGHRGTVEALWFRPDGKQLVSGGSDGTAVIWDVSQ